MQSSGSEVHTKKWIQGSSRTFLAQAMPPKRAHDAKRYKYICFCAAKGARQAGWIAQVTDPQTKRQVTVGGRRASQEAAAKAAALYLKVTVKSLSINQTQKNKSQPSRFHHIFWHRGKGDKPGGWQVILDGKSQGYYNNDLVAAKCLATLMDVKWQDLLKKSKERALPAASAERFQVWMLCLKGTCQCDLNSAVVSQLLHRNMFKEDPLLELLSLMGKYGPWRDALYSAWKENVRLQGSRSTPESRSQRALKLIHLALETLNNSRVQESGGSNSLKVWIDNCGRGVQHVLGFLPLLGTTHLGILRHATKKDAEASKKSSSQTAHPKVKPTKESSAKLLHLGCADGTYVCLPAVQQQRSLHELGKLAQAADAISAILAHPPRTCKEWLGAFQTTQGKVFPLNATGLTAQSTYTWPWLFRTWAIARMRHHKIERLTGINKISFAQFRSMFPDQMSWLHRLKRACQNKAAQEKSRTKMSIKGSGAQKRSKVQKSSVQPRMPGARAKKTSLGAQGTKRPRVRKYEMWSISRLMLQLKYRGPPELLTMYTCLIADRALLKYSSALVMENKGKLVLAGKEYLSLHGIHPHPAVLAQHAGLGVQQ
jgi:hypothetical protein